MTSADIRAEQIIARIKRDRYSKPISAGTTWDRLHAAARKQLAGRPTGLIKKTTASNAYALALSAEKRNHHASRCR